MQHKSAPIWILGDPADMEDGGVAPALTRLGYKSVVVDWNRMMAGRAYEPSPDMAFLAARTAGPPWQMSLARFREAFPGIPVIPVFDEDATTADILLAFRTGAFDCLVLPLITEAALRPMVDRALDAALRHRHERPGFAEDLPMDDITRLKARLVDAQEALIEEGNRRRHAENEAAEHRKAWSIIFDNTHDAVIHMDRDGFVVNTNATLFDVFGLTPEEVVGRDLGNYDFLGFDFRQALELYKAARPNVVFPIFEMEAFHRDGSRIYVESRARPIINNNAVEGVINIVRDVTPQKRLEHTKNATILGLAKLAESRDDSTGRHLERVREYVRILTQTVGRLPRYADYVTPAYIKDIYLSSILHDIGKVSIPDAILLKPGPLTIDEFEIIKQHTLVGGNALAAVDAELQEQSFLTLGKEIAYHHHESWDGTGYPDGLAGEQIPLSARIVALADVYDALTTERVYKTAFSHQKAVAIILEERGKKFDPDMVDAFAANMEAFDAIRRRIGEGDFESGLFPGTLRCCYK